jgi:DNA invertase Pin-like site-specific DNA recombinase
MGVAMKYGYARVSTDTQDYAAQVEALKAAGCERIYSERASGKSTNGRPELAKLMKALLPGDIVTVTKLDRVARSARDLLNIIHQLKEARCGFVSLGDAWCDTTNEMGRFMLTVMSGIAELERDLIRKRCQAGIERAKAKGTKFGRTSVLDAGQRRKVAERYAAGETMAELARDYGCGEATIWRALQGRPFSASQALGA